MLFHRQWGPEGSFHQGAIVCIHGLFGSVENLGMVTRLLKEDYQVYGLDLPNHGRSPHTDATSLQSMAEAVIAWMDSIQLSKAHFLGHSLGGKVSMEVALRYPERVQKLVVADISPVTYPRRHDDVFAGLNAVNLPTIASRDEADQAMAAFVPEIDVRRFLLKNLEKQANQWTWRINLPVLESHYDDFIGGNTDTTAPFVGDVLFIKGEQSDYVQPGHRELILQRFPNAQVKIIHGTGHWLHAEKPDIFTNIIKRFLQPS